MSFEMSIRRPLRSCSVLVLVGTLALQGCSEQIALTDAGNDPSDTCNSFRQTIVAARQTEIDQQVTNAMAGAVLGAFVGAALNNGSAQDRRQGAILGALGGGLTGLAATYYQQKAQNAADSQALLRSVNTDAARERQLVTQTGRAVQSLRNCREAQLTTLERQVRSGSVTPSDARAQLATIRRKVAEDNQIVSAAFNGIGNRVNAYVDASATAAQVNRSVIAASRPPSSAANVRSARASTTSVAAVVQDQNRAVAADNQARARVDNRIEALEILVG